MTTNPEAVPPGYTPEELNRRRAEFKRKETRNGWMAVSIFIILLFGAFAFAGTDTSGNFVIRFDPVVFLFGVILGAIVYAAAFKVPEAARRRDRASRRSEAILGSINANLARLGQLEERLMQFDSRLSRLEKSNTLPPHPP